MDDGTLPNSQSIASTSPSIPDADVLPSLVRPCKSHGSKPKAQPTITPRTFTRFFTPRSSSITGGKVGASRRALRDITASASNRSLNVRRRSPKKDSISIFEDREAATVPARKKRKIQAPVSPDITPDHSSPLRKISGPGFDILHDDSSEHDIEQDEDHSEEEDALRDKIKDTIAHGGRSIIRSKQRGAIGGLLSRELGLGNRAGRQYPACSGQDWKFETADFYSTPTDSHICDNLGDPTENAIPFCTASCNNNSLVAVGDEEGGIRLLETASAGKPAFHKAYLTFRPHTNAILDLALSPDDLLLATASGDQTSRIIDMPSQRTICALAAHSSSLKQVMFQPGSSSVMATSSEMEAYDYGISDARDPTLQSPISRYHSMALRTILPPGVLQGK